MPDVTLTIVDATPVSLSVGAATAVSLALASSTAVSLDIVNATAVSLDLVTTNVNLDFSCFDFGAFVSTVNEYDNDADAITAGKLYYKASASHESAYKGTFIIL